MSKNEKEEVVMEQPIKVKTPSQPKKQSHPEEGWEIKDRNYFLTGNKEPLTFTIKSRHTEKYPLLWFDPVKNRNAKSLKICH